MRSLKLYLDTSVISLLFQDESPDRQEVTRDFFRNIVTPRRYGVFISTVVIDEIERTPDEHRRNQMLELVKSEGLPSLAFGNEWPKIKRLAGLYHQEGVIPPGKHEDAFHVAVATVYELDVLVTWNYKHLAGLEREDNILKVNAAAGYLKKIRLLTPMGVTYP